MQRALLLPFRIALLKLDSHEAATLMASSNYAQALPVAMNAVKEGQDLFKPQPDLRLFPLYLLGAQVSIASQHIWLYALCAAQQQHAIAQALAGVVQSDCMSVTVTACDQALPT